MNTVAQFLIDEATNIRESSPELVAVDLLKQAGVSEQDAKLAVAQDAMEKKAFSELTYQGIDADEALRLIKVANVNISELPGRGSPGMFDLKQHAFNLHRRPRVRRNNCEILA